MIGALWDRHVLPRVIRAACGSDAIMEMRAKVVPAATGAVFELGCGGGLNQRFYDAGAVTSFSGVDPSGKLLDYARGEAEKRGWVADIREGVGEDLPFASDSFDTAVCTYTLCSVDDPARVLTELRRVLKPGGRLLFLEHGRAPDAKVARFQARIEPLWKRAMGNCHLTRPVRESVAAGGFQLDQPQGVYMEGMPRFAGWMEWGAAIKAG
ncbi:class I SAM-dependent methyltransferase [Novosphingobium cyanobacteriorum]|uniref:Class I SAM-dependent methyltransferase n=1 Tax=Novosphingobium cyanobacteriorum TaxID=3024215 RepID=A0ABT6CE85_9SPHN|nr:class I SAM-dependent methyltransferase [Novosphingobium cyanobacteriorum]MDF8332229.1 class I SAM-dependent methyltransferase [Novosphingobium cyanobacteriorum]